MGCCRHSKPVPRFPPALAESPPRRRRRKQQTPTSVKVKLKAKLRSASESPPSPIVSLAGSPSESSRGSVSSSEGSNVSSSNYQGSHDSALVHVHVASEHEGHECEQEFDSDHKSVSPGAPVGSETSVNSSDNESNHTRAFPKSFSPKPLISAKNKTPKSKGSSDAVASASQGTPKTQTKSTGNLIHACDISLLIETLVTHTHKWDRIGLALGFFPGELEEIKAKPTLLSDAPRSWLRDMLNTWVQWTPEIQHGKYATLEDLVKALKSKTVGLAVVAEEVLELFNDKAKLKADCTREQLLQDDSDQPDLGKQLESVSQITAITTVIPPNPTASPIGHYAYFLRCYFSLYKEPADKWPQIEVKKYTNLAIVSNEYYNRKDLEEFRKATLHGYIDDILKSKAPIDFPDLLKPNCVKGKRYSMKRVLLEGAPGIGKSTISWEICRKWGSGELFQEYSLVVLIQFRDPWVQKVSGVSDLFRFPGEPKMQSEVAKQIKRKQGKGLLLILEGFDEAPPALRKKDSLFFDLFKGLLLPNATVIMTTRPSASYDLQRCCKGESSRRIEVLGFGEKEIEEYIESAFIGSTSKEKEDFYKYLELYPHIYSMMYVPLNSAIVTHVYQSCKSSSIIVPKTMTQLYTALVKTMLLRYMMELPEYEDHDINNFSDLPKPILENFTEVCKLAYEGISNPETQIIFSRLPKTFNSLGLMQSVPELYIDKGASVSHNFLHLTIQEYLAAYHLSQLGEEEQVTFLETNLLSWPGEKMTIVSRFLAGLSPSSVCKVVALKHPSTDSDSKWYISMSELRLLFELHNPHFLSNIFGSGRMSFDYFYSHESTTLPYNIFNSCQKVVGQEVYYLKPSPFDYYVLGYCIGCSSCQWKIQIKRSNFKSNAEIFTKGVLSSLQHHGGLTCSGVTHLDLGYSSTSDGGFDIDQQLAEFVALFPQLQELSLTGKYVSEVLFTHIGSFRNLILNLPSSITSLSIEVPLCEDSYKVLANVLASRNFNLNHSLERLIINAKTSWVSPITLQYIIEGLSQNTSLKILCIHDFSSSSRVGTHTSIPDQKKNDTRCSNIYVGSNPNVAPESISGVHPWPLDSNNCIFINLVNLHLESCGLKDQAASFLGEILKVTDSKLTLLNLRTNYIRNEGAVALAKALEYNSALKSLSLCKNQIGNKGAAAIANMLTVNSTLINFDLRCNELEDEGVMMLLDSVRLHNTTMKMMKLQNPTSWYGIIWQANDKFESPPDCDRIQLSPTFCRRHPS